MWAEIGKTGWGGGGGGGGGGKPLKEQTERKFFSRDFKGRTSYSGDKGKGAEGDGSINFDGGL